MPPATAAVVTGRTIPYAAAEAARTPAPIAATATVRLRPRRIARMAAPVGRSAPRPDSAVAAHHGARGSSATATASGTTAPAATANRAARGASAATATASAAT